MLKELAIFINVISQEGYNPDINYAEAFCHSKNVFHEARAESVDGKIAVINVVQNRQKKRSLDACSVIFRKKQFSWTVYGHRLNTDNEIEVKAFEDSVVVTLETMSGLHENLIDGADHYYNPDLANPLWANKLTVVGKIGNHVFLK